MSERDEQAGREPRTRSEPGRASPEAIAQVARIRRRRRGARRQREGAGLETHPTPRFDRPAR